MERTLTTLALSMVLSLGMAQQVPIEQRETAAMKANAEQRTELVEQTVGELSEDQRKHIYGIYMSVEQKLDAMEQRYAGQPAEDLEADKEVVMSNLDNWTNKRLSSILNEGQLQKWQASLSKE